MLAQFSQVVLFVFQHSARLNNISLYVLIKRSANAGCPLVLCISIFSPSKYSITVVLYKLPLHHCKTSSVYHPFFVVPPLSPPTYQAVGMTVAYLLKISVKANPILNFWFSKSFLLIKNKSN